MLINLPIPYRIDNTFMVTYNFNDKMGNICSLFKYWFSGVSVCD